MKTKSYSHTSANPHAILKWHEKQPAVGDVPDSNTAYLGSATVATLLDVSPATLRNYVWLQSLSLKERQRRGLQSPPSKMPKPKRIRGRLYWNAQFFNKWLADRIH